MQIEREGKIMQNRQKAYAKINLTLDITSVLPDRYHGIFTAMQTVDLYDDVTVETTQAPGITLTCDNGTIPCDERNTAYKAAAYFSEAAGITEGVQIRIEKRIPSQAGLAGGSADAAAVLRAMQEIYPDKLPEQALFDIAFRIGADMPFCLAGGTRLCLNKGEVMAALPCLDAWAVIVKPEEDVSTKEAYARFDSAADLFHPNNNEFLFYAAKGEYRKALAYAYNTFEALCEVPSGEVIKSALYAGGAYYAAMSGSGSAFFGLFEDEARAQAAAETLKASFRQVFVCRTTGCFPSLAIN